MGADPNLRCSFCGATQQQFHRVVPGPEIHICNACVGRALEAILSNKPKVILPRETDSNKNPTYCSFCGKPLQEVKRLATTTTACICDECLSKCFEILMEDEKPFRGPVQFGNVA